jgi:hypothetical protein
MIALPPAIAQQFEQFLTRKALPPTVRLFYAKWLRFYWVSTRKTSGQVILRQ